MITLVHGINSVLTGFFNLLFLPWRSLNPIWAMLFISLFAGIAMLWIFGKVSDQAAIKRIRSRISGLLIGARLFRHDPATVFRLQGGILLDTLRYMRYSLMPLLIMFIPMLLALAQLNLNFSVRPFAEGETILIKAKLRDAASLKSKPILEAPAGVKIESPAVRVPAEREVSWRARAKRSGNYAIKIRVGDETVEKRIAVGGKWGETPALRTGAHPIELLLYPGESPLPTSSGIESISVRYPPLKMAVFGWNLHWLLIFFVLSLAFGFAFKGVLGVQI